jgi:hypothetical protein
MEKAQGELPARLGPGSHWGGCRYRNDGIATVQLFGVGARFLSELRRE